jgi:hypothetical protein
MGQVLLRVIEFSLSVSLHSGSPYSYINWGMNKRPVGGRSSEIVLPHRHEQYTCVELSQIVLSAK